MHTLSVLDLLELPPGNSGCVVGLRPLGTSNVGVASGGMTATVHVPLYRRGISPTPFLQLIGCNGIAVLDC
jgi:hypothetical protein